MIYDELLDRFHPGRFKSEDVNSDTYFDMLLRSAQDQIANDHVISNNVLVRIFALISERPLPFWLRAFLAALFDGKIKARRGRKKDSVAALDFRFGPAEALYQRALRVFEKLDRRER